MLFNSPAFLLFLPLVFAVYWVMNRWTEGRSGLRAQNLFLLLASYVFYGWWDWRFLSLLAFSTVLDFAIGLQIARVNSEDHPDDPNYRSRKAKRWLAVSLAINLGLLGYFKYVNFFIDSWIDAWAGLGVTMHSSSLQVILPVGISFYTFQTLSYSIDVYRRKLQPTHDFIEFAAFVSFFPQLVAGPIERASALLPQIARRRSFDYDQAVSGLRLILWGMFKKVVVADTCAIYVNDIFENYETYSGPTLILGAVYFAFQIYGDFSGYSDIAVGTARLFGISLMTNFKTPYFSRDIAEFWRRWHISLSTWFRDYLYIPLGGSRVSKLKAVRNTFIIFLVSGFWHGANWTFILWGTIHALLFLPLLLTGNNRRNTEDIQGWPSVKELLGMAGTFTAVTVAWVFFRAPSIHVSFEFLTRILTASGGAPPSSRMLLASLVLPVTLAIEWGILRKSGDAMQVPVCRGIRWFSYAAVLLSILLAWSDESTQFIYFQF
jgi:D-alanyl-lipoteichoic acid acyltransferase DltB (MBOAT superfamily)